MAQRSSSRADVWLEQTLVLPAIALTELVDYLATSFANRLASRLASHLVRRRLSGTDLARHHYVLVRYSAPRARSRETALVEHMLLRASALQDPDTARQAVTVVLGQQPQAELLNDLLDPNPHNYLVRFGYRSLTPKEHTLVEALADASKADRASLASPTRGAVVEVREPVPHVAPKIEVRELELGSQLDLGPWIQEHNRHILLSRSLLWTSPLREEDQGDTKSYLSSSVRRSLSRAFGGLDVNLTAPPDPDEPASPPGKGKSSPPPEDPSANINAKWRDQNGWLQIATRALVALATAAIALTAAIVAFKLLHPAERIGASVLVLIIAIYSLGLPRRKRQFDDGSVSEETPPPSEDAAQG